MTATVVTPGETLAVRVLERADAEEIRAFFDGLSLRSRYLRFFSPLPALSPQLVRQVTDIDHEHHEAIGAFEDRVLVAVASYHLSPRYPGRAEIAVAVSDARQGRGLATRLVRQLAVLARRRNLEGFVAKMLADNLAGVALVLRLQPDAPIESDGAELTSFIALG